MIWFFQVKFLIFFNLLICRDQFTFNKLLISSKSEKLITFVIFMNAYKYKVLSFDLTNDQINWQRYMNDLLFDFLNNFCQIVLNDIFIYSKFKKKTSFISTSYWKNWKKIDLQINIEKNKFFKKEIIFLSVLFFIDDFRINSKNIEIIINWKRFINLKKMQIFVNFVKFYRRFIRNFSKKIEIRIQMTKKTYKIWMNCKDRKSLQSFQENDDRNFHSLSLRSNQTNRFKNRFFELRQCKNVIAIRWRFFFTFRCFYNRNIISIECNYEIYDKNCWSLFDVWSIDVSNSKTLINRSRFWSITRIWKSSWTRKSLFFVKFVEQRFFRNSKSLFNFNR